MPVIDNHKYDSAPGYQVVYEIESRLAANQRKQVTIRATSERSLRTHMIEINPNEYTYRTGRWWKVLPLCYGAILMGFYSGKHLKPIYTPLITGAIIILGLLIIFKLKSTSRWFYTEIRVTPEGIGFKETTYLWKTLTNTFIVQRLEGRRLSAFLVLVTHEQRYEYINITDMNINGIPRLATAITYFSTQQIK